MFKKTCTYLFLVLSAFLMPLLMLPHTAGAWSFVSDGAVPNGGGGWDWTQASVTNKHCLACHNPTTMPDSDKTSYLLTGHKNVLRRVTAGISARILDRIWRADISDRRIWATYKSPEWIDHLARWLRSSNVLYLRRLDVLCSIS